MANENSGTRVSYVDTPEGVLRETNGVIEGPFTREQLGMEPNQYLPRCSMLRVAEPVSLSFGFGYGLKSDNKF